MADRFCKDCIWCADRVAAASGEGDRTPCGHNRALVHEVSPVSGLTDTRRISVFTMRTVGFCGLEGTFFRSIEGAEG